MRSRLAGLFPRDAELAAIPLHVRHNRARQGNLVVGDAAPDVPLHPLADGAPPTSLLAACAGAPTLLVAGSFT